MRSDGVIRCCFSHRSSVLTEWICMKGTLSVGLQDIKRKNKSIASCSVYDSVWFANQIANQLAFCKSESQQAVC